MEWCIQNNNRVDYQERDLVVSTFLSFAQTFFRWWGKVREIIVQYYHVEIFSMNLWYDKSIWYLWRISSYKIKKKLMLVVLCGIFGQSIFGSKDNDDTFFESHCTSKTRPSDIILVENTKPVDLEKCQLKSLLRCWSKFPKINFDNRDPCT